MSSYQCSVCNFDLETPITRLRVSYLGLVNDDRFPGRCVLMLKQHFETLEDMPLSLLNEYMADVKDAVTAIHAATAADHVNFAIMGDRHPHVHAHLIPRRPRVEDHPDESPWDDEREPGKMDEAGIEHLLAALRRHI